MISCDDANDITDDDTIKTIMIYTEVTGGRKVTARCPNWCRLCQVRHIEGPMKVHVFFPFPAKPQKVALFV